MPQLDTYIFSSQVISIFIFFFFYFLFLKYILPILSFDNKIRNKMLYSFKSSVMVNYLSNNGILSAKYIRYTVMVGLFDLITDYIDQLPVTRVFIPYSIIRCHLIVSSRIEEYKEIE